jgi:hypothetical protein
MLTRWAWAMFWTRSFSVLSAFEILKRQLAKLGVISLPTPRAQAAVRLIIGQFKRRQLLRVIDAAGDDRSVGIAIEKVNDHFLANAW